MKKCIVMIVVLILMFPSVVFSELAMDNQPDEYVGCWAIFIPCSSNQYGDESIIVVLNKDSTMCILTSTQTGKWMVLQDTIVFQIDGKDTYGKMDHHDDMIWFSLEGAKFGLRKIPLPDITQVVYPVMTDE